MALLPAINDVPKRRHAEAGIAITRAHLSLVRYGYGHERTKALYACADALAQDTDDPRLFMLARTTSAAQSITERARQNSRYPAGSHPNQQNLFSLIT